MRSFVVHLSDDDYALLLDLMDMFDVDDENRMISKLIWLVFYADDND